MRTLSDPSTFPEGAYIYTRCIYKKLPCYSIPELAFEITKDERIRRIMDRNNVHPSAGRWTLSAIAMSTLRASNGKS